MPAQVLPFRRRGRGPVHLTLLVEGVVWDAQTVEPGQVVAWDCTYPLVGPPYLDRSEGVAGAPPVVGATTEET